MDKGFPETDLLELESRIFKDQWSIPYKKNESFHICLSAATKLLDQGNCENEVNLQRFLNRCMPEAFRKFLNSKAAFRWNPEIQRGIFDMLECFFDLLVVRLRHKPTPVDMLNQVFALVCDLNCAWNLKNKGQRSEVFAPGKMFARNPENYGQDPYGLLVNLLNHFGAKNGFGLLKDAFTNEELDLVDMAAILEPLGNCAELLNPSVVCPILISCMDRSVMFVTTLEDGDFVNQDSGAVLKLLATLRLLSRYLWPKNVNQMNATYLEIVLRMLKVPHLATRINALKEVSKLIQDEAESTLPNKRSIPGNQFEKWLSQHQVLSIALEGNNDYCLLITDQVKELVKFHLEQKLSAEIDNLHMALAAAAPKLSPARFDYLLDIVRKNWITNSTDQKRERLVCFLGRLGKECRVGLSQILKTLWEFCRYPQLSSHLVERALDEHLSILFNDIPQKQQERKLYVLRFIEDLKKGNLGTLPVLRCLLKMARSIVKETAGTSTLSEWNSSHEIGIHLIASLGRCHRQAVVSAKELGQPLSHETIVDGQYDYRHGQLVEAHLELLQVLLNETEVTYPCKDIWDILVKNQDACEADRESCFQWFSSCLGNKQEDTPSLVTEVSKVRYRDQLISIFMRKDSNNEGACRFYFEPLVSLDPNSIIDKTHAFLKQEFVRITIQMWNAEVRVKVLERLRSMPQFSHLKLRDDDICVMPYEDVQLVCKWGGNSQSIRLLEQPTSYLRSRESLDFFLLCDSHSTACALAEDFRQNPEFTLNSWQLALECHGLTIKSGTDGKVRPTTTFNVSVHPH